MPTPVSRLVAVATVGLVVAAVGLIPAHAQKPAPRPAPPMERPQTIANPLVASVRATYDRTKGYLLAAAEEMPAADYGFRPVTLPSADHATIRTFGAVLGHLAVENIAFCAQAQGAKAPATAADLEAPQTTKATLTKALADSFAYCDGVWTGTTDANAGQAASGSGPSATRLGTLVASAGHDAEHYGNLVTYLRAKGLVPPSSQPAK